MISERMLREADLASVERLARALGVDMSDRASWLATSNTEHREWRAIIGGRVYDAIRAMTLRDHLEATKRKNTKQKGRRA